jgi:isoleucyl-tRNA synthetase
MTEDNGVLVKKIKPNFKALGPRYGKLMKQIAAAVNGFSQDDIKKLEQEKEYLLTIDGQEVLITPEDVEISTEDIPGWIVANQGNLTVALDISITPELKQEGLARELVNRVQNIRKDTGLEVTDHIVLTIEKNENTEEAFTSFKNYICSETLAEVELVDNLNGTVYEPELTDGITAKIAVRKKEK